jgi:hypothetical protein
MLANFFGALMLHVYWTSDNVFEQCHAWHQAILQPTGTWNISILDEVELSHTYEHICHVEHIRATAKFDLKVCSFFPHNSPSLMSPSLFFLLLYSVPWDMGYALYDLHYALCDLCHALCIICHSSCIMRPVSYLTCFHPFLLPPLEVGKPDYSFHLE